MIHQRFTPAPGRIAVIRDEADEFWSEEFGWVKVDDTKEFEKKINPWALVVGVGASRVTDYGTTISTDIQPGERVLIGEVGRTVVLKTSDDKAGSIYVLPFEGVLGRLEWQCDKCKASCRVEPENDKCPNCPSLLKPSLQDMLKLAGRKRAN